MARHVRVRPSSLGGGAVWFSSLVLTVACRRLTTTACELSRLCYRRLEVTKKDHPRAHSLNITLLMLQLDSTSLGTSR